MNIFRERYKNKYDTVEPYLALKLQLTVIFTLIISIAGEMITQYFYAFNIITILVLLLTLREIKEEFHDKLKIYSTIFTAFYTAALLLPYLTNTYLTRTSATDIRGILFLLIGFLILLIIFKVLVSRKEIEAEVLMANEKLAVVKPEYSVMLGVKPEEYVVSNKGASKGDKVKLKLNKKPFKPPEPSEIKEVVK